MMAPFRLQRHWVADFARTSAINSLEGMTEAFLSDAAATMDLDLPPDGPSYHTQAYCIGLECGVGSKVVARIYIFSDRCTKKQAPVSQ